MQASDAVIHSMWSFQEHVASAVARLFAVGVEDPATIDRFIRRRRALIAIVDGLANDDSDAFVAGVEQAVITFNHTRRRASHAGFDVVADEQPASAVARHATMPPPATDGIGGTEGDRS